MQIKNHVVEISVLGFLLHIHILPINKGNVNNGEN